MERAKGVEPSTFSLATRRSTTELCPQFFKYSTQFLWWSTIIKRPINKFTSNTGIRGQGHEGLQEAADQRG